METKQIVPYKNHCPHCDFTFSLSAPAETAKEFGYTEPFKTRIVCPNAKCSKEIVAVASLI